MLKKVAQGFRLSRQQKHLWLLQQADDSLAYRARCGVLIEGELDRKALEAAIENVCGRHEILRTSFCRLPGMSLPLQVVTDSAHPAVNIFDLSETAPQEQGARLETLFDELRQLRLDPGRAPQWQNFLAVLSREKHVLMFVLPALCADMSTLKNLVEEISHAYEAALGNREALNHEVVQYVQFSEWQNEIMESEDAEAAREFWSAQRPPANSVLKLPFERAPLGKSAFLPESLICAIDAEAASKINSLARDYETATSVFLSACWQTLLWHLTGRADLAVGNLFQQRQYEELQTAPGPFAEMLPIRARLQRDLHFRELLRQLKEQAGEIGRWQEYYSRHAHIQDENSAAEALFFPICFEYETEPEKLRAADVTFSIYRRNACSDRFTLKLSCFAQGDSLKLELGYDSQLFKPGDVRCLARQLRTVIENAIEKPDATLGDLGILSDAELRQLLLEFNHARSAYSKDVCVHRLFEEQAASIADAVALIYEDEQLSYRELNERANQLAHYLRGRGVGPESLVGICVERSIEMVVGLLGVLKAGGAYVPLEPQLPPDRLSFMLEDTGAEILLTRQSLLGKFSRPPASLFCLDSEWEACAGCLKTNPSGHATPGNALYVIYTSGSTGKPKGVMIEHRQLLAYLHAIVERLGFTRSDHYGLISTFAADLGYTVLYPSLCTGGCLHVISQNRASDSQALAEYLSRHPIDCLKIVPSHISALLQPNEDSRVMPRKQIVLGGEALHRKLIEKIETLSPDCRIHNHYGPTETTVGVTTLRLDQEHRAEAWSTIPIGRPLANTEIYLLDERLEPVAIGVAGELYVGGDGLARGYLKRPELTADRFVPHPVGRESGARLYQTGDRARYLSDGKIEFLGRIDNQVKLRGYRVELGEVEAALRQHEAVKDCAVVIREDEGGDKRLVAYLVTQQGASLDRAAQKCYTLPNRLTVVHKNKNETDHVYHEIFEKRSYFKHGISLPENACIFDVGANIGLFSIFVAQHYRHTRVYAFEPISSLFSALQANLALYAPNARLFPYGLSDLERSATFTYYPHYTVMSGLSAYADAESEERVIKNYMIHEGKNGREDVGQLLAHSDELLAGRFKAEEEECRLRRLSDVMREEGVESIDLLKVDVQRAEMDVLQGVLREDWKRIRQVVMEVHDEPGTESEGRLSQVENLLREQGFEIVVERDEFLREIGRFNVFALRKHDETVDAQIERWREREGPELPEMEAPLPLISELRKYLQERLPDYMVPAAFVQLQRLPLTPNGKLDRQALPALEMQSQVRRGYEPPVSETERRLADIWADLLRLDRVGRQDNFFELGGHSLLAVQALSRLRQTLGVEVALANLFMHPTLADFARTVERSAQAELPPITPVDRNNQLELSFAQQRLWFLAQFEGASEAYHIAGGLRLKGDLDRRAMRRALDQIVARHEALRTTFRQVDGRPIQVIGPSEKGFQLEEVNLFQAADAPGELRRIAEREASEPFDLERGPLIRGRLVQLAEDDYVLLVTMHHIIADGWSMGIMIDELSALYGAYRSGEADKLPELPIQYADFAVWQRSWMQGEALENHLAYWRRQLGGELPMLELPVDKPRPAMQTRRGAERSRLLPGALSDSLKALSLRQNCTLFMTLLAAFKTLLYYLTGQTDICVGTDIANRNRAEIEKLIGFFVNQLVLRTELSPDSTFEELLRKVREITLRGYAHQDLPFEKLVEALNPKRDANRTPLFQVKMALQNVPVEELDLPGLKLSPIEATSSTAKFDLFLSLQDMARGISASLQYNTDLFEEPTPTRILNRFHILLDRIVERPGARLRELVDSLIEEDKREEAEKDRDLEIDRLRKLKIIRRKVIGKTCPETKQ
jgi:amino acid adenylation domain-containing protein/FkbM family methyltransferase